MENEKLDDYTCPKCHGQGLGENEDNSGSNENYVTKGLTKSMSLWRLPPILIVQMKRFKFDKISYQHRKLNQRIKFPSSSSSGDETIKSYLDMAPYMTNSKMENFEEIEPGLYKAKMNREEGEDEETLCTSYDLYAVIHHSGALGSGHYVATVKDSEQRKGAWYCYNDDEVNDNDNDDNNNNNKS